MQRLSERTGLCRRAPAGAGQAGRLAVRARAGRRQAGLPFRRGCSRLYPDALVVHRLDMATSGPVADGAGRPRPSAPSVEAFAQRQVSKRYVAVVAGRAGTSLPPDDWALIDLPIAADWPNRPRRIIEPERGKPSQTRWRVLAYDEQADVTRVALEPLTGRTHQLRVHLQALGHPILGDALYAPPEVQARAPRLLLHATRTAVCSSSHRRDHGLLQPGRLLNRRNLRRASGRLSETPCALPCPTAARSPPPWWPFRSSGPALRAQPAAARQQTPSQTEGPFYPVSLPKDSDFDLLRNGTLDYKRGQPAWVEGSVTDLQGKPVAGAQVEIWQCDEAGPLPPSRRWRQGRPCFPGLRPGDGGRRRPVPLPHHPAGGLQRAHAPHPREGQAGPRASC